MRLEPVCTMFLRYTPRFPTDTRLAAVMPGHGVGAGYGEGTGYVVGDRLSGQLYWSNRPTVRSDNVVLGDFYGILLTDDGTYIVFSMARIRGAVGRRAARVERQARRHLGVTFQADHPDYRWVTQLTSWPNPLCQLSTRSRSGSSAAPTRSARMCEGSSRVMKALPARQTPTLTGSTRSFRPPCLAERRRVRLL